MERGAAEPLGFSETSKLVLRDMADNAPRSIRWARRKERIEWAVGMKTLKATVYYKLNNESFIRTRSLTRRFEGDEAPAGWTTAAQQAAEYVATAMAVWEHGPKTTITIQNFRLQLVEEVY